MQDTTDIRRRVSKSNDSCFVKTKSLYKKPVSKIEKVTS